MNASILTLRSSLKWSLRTQSVTDRPLPHQSTCARSNSRRATVGLLNEYFAPRPDFYRPGREHHRHCASFAKLVLQAFRSPPESGVGWCFGAMPRSRVEGQSDRPYCGPAPVFFVATCARLANGAEELSGNVASARVLPVEPDGVRRLDFDQTVAAATRDAQNLAGQRRQTLPGYTAVRALLSLWFGKYSSPVLVRYITPWTAFRSALPGCFRSEFLHLLRGGHTPACRSIGHGA